MGRLANNSIDSSSTHFWDYANSGLQSDELDLYIFSKTAFCISTRYGLDEIALLFGKPLVLIDHGEDLFCPEAEFLLPKTFTWVDSGKTLTIEEINEFKVSEIRKNSDFAKIGVQWHSNTSLRIAHGIKEYLESRRVVEGRDKISAVWENGRE
jgi:putative glycosyltransferase (TIGR04372 family)